MSTELYMSEGREDTLLQPMSTELYMSEGREHTLLQPMSTEVYMSEGSLLQPMRTESGAYFTAANEY